MVHAGPNQVRAGAAVVAIVPQGIGDRRRRADAAREVDDGGDAVLRDHGPGGLDAAGIALDEGHLAGHGRTPPGREVVEGRRRRSRPRETPARPWLPMKPAPPVISSRPFDAMRDFLPARRMGQDAPLQSRRRRREPSDAGRAGDEPLPGRLLLRLVHG